MDVTPLVRQGSKIIQSYADGKFRISGDIFEGGVIVTAETVTPWHPPASIKDLTEENFMTLASSLQGFDVLLMGTGKTLSFPETALRLALKSKKINLDFMDTGAACRTYNVLMAEGRRVAAILMPL